MANRQRTTDNDQRTTDVARIAALLMVSLTLSCATVSLPRHETGFLDRSVKVGGTSYPYVVYIPRTYDPSRAWPVILFLHGAGERGSEGIRATQIGIAAAIRAHPERAPAIIVFPEAPAETRWLGEPADAAMGALDQTMAELNTDPHRVYLTGLSMGGYGTWHLAMAHPERWAALVVVCGGLLPHATTTSVQQSPLNAGAANPYAFTAHAVRNLPIWIFHGTEDPVIPVEEAKKMDAALVKEGAPNFHYTEFPGVGHNAWDKVYSEEGMWRWLFEQKR